MKDAVVYFHQGWTDIINCISLVHYVASHHEKVYVVIREDAKDLILYTFQDWKNTIIPICVQSESLEKVHPFDILKLANLPLSDLSLQFFGDFDTFREDSYADSFSRAIDEGVFFVEAFYTTYAIPYSVRTDMFAISRNKEREDEVYNTFVERYGSEYGLTHGIPISSKNYPIVELNQISTYFFDMFRVLECATEIHVIDSVWAAILYLLQTKYGICSDIPIFISCTRGYDSMFTSPVKHPNWVWMNDSI